MSNNLNDVVLDEIALEGLDGITLEGLWSRLSDRLKIPLPFNQKIKRRFWEVVKILKPINIYEIPEPRPFFIFDRYTNIESEFGVVVDPEEIPLNIYPYYPVKDTYIQGSCKHFETRVDKTSEIRQMTVDEVENLYPNKVVLVANQEVRYNTLVGSNYQLTLTAIQYCILERIGRSRYLGEVTIGKVSLQDIGESAKSLFYHRKTLLQHKLITKQPYQHKCGVTNNCGCLLHLPRFYVERKPKALLVIEEVVEILRAKPNHVASYEEVKNHFVDNIGFKKIWKTAEFQRVIRTDVKVKYKDLHPESDNNLWLTKHGEDRLVRCFQLIDPNVDINEIWMKEDVEDDDEHGLLNNKNQPLDMPLTMYALKLITEAGNKGMTQNELSTALGTNRLNARAICRNLVRRKSVTFFVDNIGRQRVTKFMSKYFIKDSHLQRVFSEHDILTANRMAVDSTRSQDDSEIRKRKASEECNDETLTKQQRLDHESSPKIDSQTNDLNHELKITNTDSHNIVTTIERTNKIPGMTLHNFSFMESGKSWSGKTDCAATITYRFLKRMNLLIKFVKEEKVINDFTKLMKRINEEEEADGDFTKIDKKTLYRLILKVESEGHIKLYKVTLSLPPKEKTIIFICEPHIEIDYPLITSEIDRAKMKFFVAKQQFINHDSEDSYNKLVDCNESVLLKDQNEYMKSIYKRSAGREYGYRPRFVRLKLLHQLMYYLIYEQNTEEKGHTKDEVVPEWISSGIKIDDELFEELPEPIFSKEIGWKMFIPPIHHPKDWPTGWSIVCDIIFRTPINILVKIICIPYALPELEEILKHPIKKYYLLKHLPENLRSCILFKRRYIFSIYNCLLQLCFMGIVQFGAQRFKEKDQQFVFLNKRALIWDTRTSERGYNQISEKKYPIHKFEFNTFEDLDKYWYELWNICIHTFLGMRTNLSEDQETVVIEFAETKPILLKYTEPQKPEEAVQNDIGYIPGDHRGAGGLDSSLFAHIRRNWAWPARNTANLPTKSPRLNMVVNSIKRKRLSYKDLSSKSPARKRIVMRTRKTDKILNATTNTKTNKKSKFKVTKIVQQRRPRKPFYDEVDKEALKRMNKLRVTWSPEEDRILLLCKVAFLYLSPKNKKHIIVFQHVRDCLHRLLDSKNKTSRACQRRINYVMKNPITQKSVALFLEELSQCNEVRSIFKNIPKDKIGIAFVVLLGILLRKFNRGNQDSIEIPDTIEEFQTKYEFYTPKLLKTEMSYKPPESICDIQTSVLQSTVHSTMCSAADKSNWNYQLFKVYQEYPEVLVRSVMNNMRRYQLVSIKKSAALTFKKQFSKFPLTNCPYQLSQSYKHKLVTKHPYNIFSDSFSKISEFEEMFSSVAESTDTKHEVIAMNGGAAAALFELYLTCNFHLTVQIPEQVIILDPALKSQSEPRYEKIYKRFEDIVKNFSVPDTVDLDDDNDEFIIPDKTESSNRIKQNDNANQPCSLKSLSRVAFYMMRGETVDSLDIKATTQHMHDFFVVNSTLVFIDVEDRSTFLKQLHPDDVDQKNRSVIEHIQKFAVITSKVPSLPLIQKKILDEDGNELDLIFCKELIDFIRELSYLGASSNLLKNQFPVQNGLFTLYRMLNLLVNFGILIRCGITHETYVHYNHIKSWVIKSFKLKRSEREKLPKILSKDTESLNELFEDNDENEDEQKSDEDDKKNKQEISNNPSTSKLKKSQNSLEEITVNIQPWIRIDGSLNRRILDRWMGAVLCYCMDNPGVLVERVCQRFSHLKPFEIKLLLEYLEKLECVQFFKVVPEKVTLFSKSSKVHLAPVNGLEDFNEIFVETLPTCVTKFGMFIGKKQYKNDFLSDHYV